MLLTMHTVILQYWTSNQKGFLKSCVRDSWGLDYQGTAIPALSKWHFSTLFEFDFFSPNDFISSAIKVPLFNIILNMYQALPSSAHVLIREDKLDYLKNPSQDFKNHFCSKSFESLATLECKIRASLFFRVQSGKKTVWM